MNGHRIPNHGRFGHLCFARLGVFALILSLTTVNLLNFYIDQFTAVATALLEFAALLVVVSYREWRLR